MSLARPARAPARVSLVPLIDVLFILLVYFMVTSVYLDLDMIPAAGGPRADLPAAPAGAESTGAAAPLLVRLDAQGRAVLQGEPLALPALEERLAEEVAARPGLDIVLLPSPRAPVQALATALDAVAGAGVSRSRILQIEAAE